jgi:hypothetical protein
VLLDSLDATLPATASLASAAALAPASLALDAELDYSPDPYSQLLKQYLKHIDYYYEYFDDIYIHRASIEDIVTDVDNVISYITNYLERLYNVPTNPEVRSILEERYEGHIQLIDTERRDVIEHRMRIYDGYRPSSDIERLLDIRRSSRRRSSSTSESGTPTRVRLSSTLGGNKKSLTYRKYKIRRRSNRRR